MIIVRVYNFALFSVFERFLAEMNRFSGLFDGVKVTIIQTVVFRNEF